MLVPGLITFLTLLLFGPGHLEAHVKTYPRIAAALPGERILIVAPHVDDEAIGAAGYATDAIANGAEVYVVFLTAGDCNRFAARLLGKTFEPTATNYLAIGRTRIAEAQNAMRFLGVPESHYFVLGYPDRGLRPILQNRHQVVQSLSTNQRSVPYAEAMSPGSPYSYASLMMDMERVIAIARPTTVIAPVEFDLHPDHSAAAEITESSLAAAHVAPQRLGYLVHASRVPMSLLRMPERALVPPSRMRSFDWAVYPLTQPVQKRKDALLQSYRSQRPYTSILRNAFVRTNELFFVYPQAAQHAVIPPHAAATAATPARIPIAR